MSSTSLTGKVLKNKWRLGALVGTGACADVYEATDVSAGVVTEFGKFVAKVAPVPVDLPARPSKALLEQTRNANLLNWEYTLYQGFLRPLRHPRCVVDIPHNGYGDDQDLRYLVMTRLGPDIQAVKDKSKSWPLSRTIRYAQQMLQILRALHERCQIVFVDVKPENFLFGQAGSADEDKIFLVDFGLSDKFTDIGGSIKPHTKRSVKGTPEFLSLKCHGGWNAGRCDDLESLGYVIVSMLKKGSSELPWCGSTSIQHGLDMKRNTSLETLCQGCPAGMLEYMRAVRAMSYEETPNYDKLGAILQSFHQNDSGGRSSTAFPADNVVGTRGRVRGAATRGSAASGMSKRKRGRSEAEAVRPSSEHPMKLRRRQPLSS